jgi:5-(carboxyamino)imidazole ribonucleotide mutase
MSCSLPVIGVPVPGGPLNGIDALLAISQVPGGVPCTTVGLHKKAPVNAAMAAHRILKLAEKATH